MNRLAKEDMENTKSYELYYIFKELYIQKIIYSKNGKAFLLIK